MTKRSPPVVTSSFAPGSYLRQGLRHRPRLPAFISLPLAKKTFVVRYVSEAFQSRSRATRSQSSAARRAMTSPPPASHRGARPRRTSGERARGGRSSAGIIVALPASDGPPNREAYDRGGAGLRGRTGRFLPFALP